MFLLEFGSFIAASVMLSMQCSMLRRDENRSLLNTSHFSAFTEGVNSFKTGVDAHRAQIFMFTVDDPNLVGLGVLNQKPCSFG